MRVLQLAPLWETVPPPRYGGTEAVIGVLCDELVRRGIDVTLCASGDSRTKARLQSVYPRSLRTAEGIGDYAPYDWMHAALSLRDARDYDLVHNHAGEMAMAMSHLSATPMLTTMHCLISPDTKFVWDRYQGWYNTISHAQHRAMPPVPNGVHAGVVYNGIDVESFPFSNEKDDYLLYLSRISPEKGPHLAIAAARRLGMRLLIAAKIDRADRQFYHDVVEPEIDGEQIVFLGEADAVQKRELYKRARCLLLPLGWEEPFGLVMAEAMACGTPVIAFDRGSAPELIIHGETGYLVDDVDGMVNAVHKLDRIDPARCRQHVAEKFSPEQMAERYIELYRSILNQRARSRPYTRPVAVPAGSHNGSNGANGARAIA